MPDQPVPCCTTGNCFDCRFWNEKVTWAANGDTVPSRTPGSPDDRVARARGLHYVIRPMDHTTPAQYLGFGGRLFTFQFADGSTVTSNNVMCQGEIPTHWRNRLPDNAVIVPAEQRTGAIPFGPTEGQEASK
ncbi:hypothetical protein [Streptomyces sp. WAC08241]|uniref:hypothetical protein n=1 Tax=Streptomyces sp. WAC08241 TaxID=2487421 RepID=UPI000F778FD8|nr:hypothetical protein [Streptomyces sp. WAC08241]RSS32568.1 hypothetical protein EF906_33680 [Streptomyces sp. WAC08241]